MQVSSKPIRPGQDVNVLILQKQHSYYVKSLIYRYLYYGIRFVVGIGAALVPFMMSRSPDVVSVISLTIVVVTVVDTVVAPQAKWKLYSRASDRMWVSQIQALGEYDRHKDRIEEILATEKGELDLINDLRSMLSERPSTASAGKRSRSVAGPTPRP